MSVFSFPNEVNERAPRIVAVGVVLLADAALLTGWELLPWLLAAGFLLRVAWGPRFSPLARLAVWLAPRLGPAVLVPGRPKRFAQAIGAVVTVSASVLAAAGWVAVSSALLVILVVFATLESVLGLCFGCWLHGRLQHAGWIAADACESCVVRPTR